MSLNPVELCSISELSHLNTTTNDSFLDILEHKDMINPQIRKIIENHTSSQILIQVLRIMFKLDMLTETNLTIVISRRNPFNFYYALQNLKDHKLLNIENINLVTKRENALDLIYPILILRQANIHNIDIITSVVHPTLFAKILTCLNEAHLLDQTNFDSLMQANHVFLLTKEAYEHIWAKIPSHLLNQANFLRLLKAAGSPAPLAQLQRVRDIIINLQTQPKLQPTLQLTVSSTSSLHGSLYFKPIFSKQEELKSSAAALRF